MAIWPKYVAVAKFLRANNVETYTVMLFVVSLLQSLLILYTTV